MICFVGCALRALKALDNVLELKQEDVSESFSKIFPCCSIYLFARLLLCGYKNWVSKSNCYLIMLSFLKKLFLIEGA